MRKLLLIVCCIPFLFGCQVSEETGILQDGFTSESLIEAYYLATSFNPIRIVYTDGAPIGMGECPVSFIVTEAEKAPLSEMRQKYDDTHYHSFIPYHGYYSVYANEFTAVDLVSDTDFNGIQAGESLGGIVRLHALSPYRWLASESKDTFDWKRYDDTTFWPNKSAFPISQLFPVNHFLKDLTTDDLRLLMWGHTFLYFEELPVIKNHTLTLTFYEGETAFSASTQVVFQ